MTIGAKKAAQAAGKGSSQAVAAGRSKHGKIWMDAVKYNLMELSVNIDELTIGQAREVAAMMSGAGYNVSQLRKHQDMNVFLEKDVIIRTESAGVWFGNLVIKNGREVVLRDARRMWQWKCKQGISLSEIALYGIDPEGSRICAPVPRVWIEAIEIIPVMVESAKSIKEAEHAKAE